MKANDLEDDRRMNGEATSVARGGSEATGAAFGTTAENPQTMNVDALVGELESTRGRLAQLEAALNYERYRNDSLERRLLAAPEDQTTKEIAQLRSRVAELEAELKKREAETPSHLKHLRPDEIQAMDQHQLDIQARVAQGVAESVLNRAPVIEKLKDLEVVAKTAAERAERMERAMRLQRFWESVEAVVPGAQQINATDPGWAQFLSQVDPLSGRTRRELGEQAIASGDTGRVVMLLQEYLLSQPGRRTVNGGQQAVTQVTQPPAQNPKPDETTTATARAPEATPTPMTGRAAQTSEGGKPVYTRSQMSAFYRDAAKGRFTREEREKWDAEFTAAVLEGRIVEG